MISDEVKERILPDEISGAVERVGVSSRFRLRREANHGGEVAIEQRFADALHHGAAKIR